MTTHLVETTRAERAEPHSIDVQETAITLGTSLTLGLSSDEARRRLERDGPNEIASAPPPSVLRRLARQFTDAVVLLLFAAAAVSLAIDEWLDAVAILAIVLMNGALGFSQEERAARAIDALREMTLPKARVVRDGKPLVVAAHEIVRGDRVELEAGDSVPADLRLIETVAARAKESALTGESLPVEKDARRTLDPTTSLAERSNLAFMGTSLVAGRASGLVIATGLATELGGIATLLERTQPRPTPLQQRLAAMGRALALACLVIVAIVGALLLRGGATPSEVLLLSIGLAVAAVPEGLPAAVTIALALGMRRLVERHALVRTLPSVETLGSVTVICTDKTGTLTRNEMSVREIATSSALVRCAQSGRPQSSNSDPRARNEIERAWSIGVRCTNARWSKSAGARGERVAIGDPTETALLVAAAHAGVESERPSSEPVVFELPFDSERRRMSVATRRDGSTTLYVKGAAEVVLPRCARVLRGDATRDLSEAQRAEILAQASGMADRALRVLALAYRDAPLASDDPETELVFVGLVGLQDPPRAEAADAVRSCRRAGIRPVMVTGDHPRTAIAIAREVGIAAEDDRAVLGEELERWSEAELERRVASIPVFARTSAAHKLRIVRAWHAHGDVVAMTGDGVNDAPALHEADIGIAMGRSGTDVSRQAADIVLVDDNFASIVAAVREGRGVFDNIRKFVHFLLTTNSSEILVIACAVAAGLPAPLTAIQLLWINLVTDGLPALALGVEPTEDEAMQRRPRGLAAAVVTRGGALRIVLRGALFAATALGAYAYELRTSNGSFSRATTIVFAVLVFAQLFSAFAFRSPRVTALRLGLRTNSALLGAVVAAATLQLAVLLTPALRTLFSLEPLTLRDLGGIALWSLVPTTVIELGKLLRRPRAAR